jgi:hypothetical protein
MWILSPEPKMFDVNICCSSWRDADAVVEQARAGGFRVEVRDGVVDFEGKTFVFLRIWCTGAVDRIAEIRAIVDPTDLGTIEDWGTQDDPPRYVM